MGALEQVAVKGAEQFFDRGVLGLVCVLLILTIIVLGLVIRALDKRLTKLNADALTDRERLITAIEAGESAVEGLTAAMRGVQTTLETRGQTVGELSHQIALQGQEASHKLANLSQAVSMIAGAVRRDATGGAP